MWRGEYSLLALAVVCFVFAVSTSGARVPAEVSAVVVGAGECVDCTKLEDAFKGLYVAVDCKNDKGELVTMSRGELDKEGNFHIQLSSNLIDNKECHARVLDAMTKPCPSSSPLDATKLTLKHNKNGVNTFTTKGKLSFSKSTCTSATFWAPHPWFTPHPWFKPDHPWFHLPPKPYFPPKYSPPVYVPPPTPPAPVYVPPSPPVYEKPPPVYVPPTPVYKPPTPVYKPPTPVYKPPTPVYKPPTPVYKPPTPVYKPPTPVYKPPYKKKPICPPVYKPPVYVKPPSPPVYVKPPIYMPPFKKPPMYLPPFKKPPMYLPPFNKPPMNLPPCPPHFKKTFPPFGHWHHPPQDTILTCWP